MARCCIDRTGGSLIARTCKLFRCRAHAAFDTVGLYRGQQFALQVLWREDGLTHSELAERLAVQPATVSPMVKRMEKAGLVERRRDPADERISRVYLTPAGRNARGSVETVWQDLEARIFEGFSAEERDQFERFLTRVVQNLAQER